VLGKDYKECVMNQYTVGFSTVTTLLSDFLSPHTINTALRQFYTRHKLDAFIILGIMVSDPSGNRIGA